MKANKEQKQIEQLKSKIQTLEREIKRMAGSLQTAAAGERNLRQKIEVLEAVSKERKHIIDLFVSKATGTEVSRTYHPGAGIFRF